MDISINGQSLVAAPTCRLLARPRLHLQESSVTHQLFFHTAPAKVLAPLFPCSWLIAAGHVPVRVAM